MGQTAYYSSSLCPDVISTGSLYLDQALSIGGIPHGYLTEISGDYSTGKTTLCLNIIAEAQRSDGVCAFVDSDRSFNYHYAVQCGVLPDQLFLVQPTCAEEALEIVSLLAGTKAFAAIIIDSLTSLVPYAEQNAPAGMFIEESIEPILSKWLPHLSATIRQNQTALVLTNAVSSGMSRVYHRLEDNLDRLALPLSAAIRLKLSRTLETHTDQPTQRIQAQVIKNKFAPCSKTVDIDIIVNRGINKTGELINLGEKFSVLTRHGLVYYFQANRLGSQQEEVNSTLHFNPGLAHEIEQAIRQIMFAG